MESLLGLERSNNGRGCAVHCNDYFDHCRHYANENLALLVYNTCVSLSSLFDKFVMNILYYHFYLIIKTLIHLAVIVLLMKCTV